jgi:hypothetical protein
VVPAIGLQPWLPRHFRWGWRWLLAVGAWILLLPMAVLLPLVVLLWRRPTLTVVLYLGSALPHWGVHELLDLVRRRNVPNFAPFWRMTAAFSAGDQA